MSSAQLLLRAYYERLYERMVAARARLEARIDELLPAEVELRGLGPLNPEGLQAYREACLAFVTERLEAYNPIGIQYTFSRTTTKLAAELEFQLNWYDSRREFSELVAAARDLAGVDVDDEILKNLADRLIRQMGAFPDRSIHRCIAVLYL
jgi:MoxR-like ATPase